MNDTETAIDCLKHQRDGKGIVVNDKICNIAIGALEKQIPKKPEKGTIPYCPHCNKVFVTSNNDYCHRCGGKIDWSVSNL